MLAPGTKVGSFSILAQIGAGGMGEVYRATDSKLGRDVALKILPAEFAQDAQRMARFQREAHVLASLNHPHIAAIYGLEDAAGSTGYQPVSPDPPARAKYSSHLALVMELVEGPTLAERIAQSTTAVPGKLPAIPLDEALPIARQIAEALEYAHDRGIIHRDLKPANIKLTPDGNVKLLDFGLAKALADDPASAVEPSNSPTLSMAATKAGIILGTAAYMPPEQAKGKSVDRRADIWSFGCVLYEMLTGQRAFIGEDVSETLAAIIRGEPDWNALPLPPRHPIHTLLRRCLEKDAKRRLQAIGEARVVIDDYLANPAAAEAALAAPAAGVAPAGARAVRSAWALATLATVAALVFATAYFRRPGEEPRVVRAFIPAPQATTFDFAGSPLAGPPAVSPDGRYVVFAAHESGKQQTLWLRAIDALGARQLPGTDGGSYPFWSPDSRSIGFFAQGKLKKTDVAGSPPVSLCDSAEGRGGAWNRDGTIVFGLDANSPLRAVSDAGGVSRVITELDVARAESTHRWPHFLPDGRNFVFLARAGFGDSSEGTAIMLGALDGTPPKPLVAASSNGMYASGHLLFVRDSALMAQPFDAQSLKLTGEAFPVVEQIQYDPALSRGIFSVSENGVLIYQTGEVSSGRKLTWFDRRGGQLGVLGDEASYVDLSISPDESKVAVAVIHPAIGPPDIWVYEIARNLRTRFTFDTGVETHSVWSPDSTRLIYRGSTKGLPSLRQKSLTGTSDETPLLPSSIAKFPASWSADGRFLAYEERGVPGTVADIWVLPLAGNSEPALFLKTPFRERQPRFSPDGRWMAYVSNESGRDEVYVAPFPGPGRKWQISTGGGEQPRWRRDGREIFYVAEDNTITAVEVEGRGETFHVGAAARLFQIRPLRRNNFFDVSGDGKRFLVNAIAQEQASEPMTLVINWPAALPRKP